MESLEKLAISAAAYLAIVILRLLFKEFRDNEPYAAMEAVLRRLFGRRKTIVAPEPTTTATPVDGGRRDRLVTVFAEAAFDAGCKFGVWSAWARDGSRTVQRTGVLDGHIHTRDHASVEALSKGINLAVEGFGLGRGDSIVAQSASKHAVDVLSGRKALRKNRKDEALAVAFVRTMLDGKGVTLHTKHVHDAGGDIARRFRASMLAERQAQLALEKHLCKRECNRDELNRA